MDKEEIVIEAADLAISKACELIANEIREAIKDTNNPCDALMLAATYLMEDSRRRHHVVRRSDK